MRLEITTPDGQTHEHGASLQQAIDVLYLDDGVAVVRVKRGNPELRTSAGVVRAAQDDQVEAVLKVYPLGSTHRWM
ncbi:hypothetical protein [Micropruina sp.]|uniref:hypothetical protein n=1 Tax=Micropruina sp. TaxID=2737536 RepID=UPI0039E41B8C